MAKLLYTLREHRDLPAETWQQFREKAAADGCGPSAALSRLIRRYLARGFDDDQAAGLPPARRPADGC
jgi:hypothetical protein